MRLKRRRHGDKFTQAADGTPVSPSWCGATAERIRNFSMMLRDPDTSLTKKPLSPALADLQHSGNGWSTFKREFQPKRNCPTAPFRV